MDNIKNNKGFTLLEVIFAVSILTIGILAVAAMQASSIRGNAFAWGTSEASTVAMAQIERMMGWDYDDLVDGDSETGQYSMNWVVTEDAIINQTKTVNLTISWKDHGVDKNLKMSFIVGQVV